MQVAANNRGILLVRELIQEYSLEVVQAYMTFIQVPTENHTPSDCSHSTLKWQSQISKKYKKFHEIGTGTHGGRERHLMHSYISDQQQTCIAV